MPLSAARGMPPTAAALYRGDMDIASMIMGGSIASIAWIAFYPWAKLKRLQQLEADAASASGPE